MEPLFDRLEVCRDWKKSRRLCVCAASEDSTTGARVDDLCHLLERYGGDRGEITRHLWLSNELRIPQLRAIASAEAASADLLVLSLHHGQQLPEELRCWLEDSLSAKKRHAVFLLAMFDPAYDGDSTSLLAYLKTAAERAKVEFVSQFEDAPQGRMRL